MACPYCGATNPGNGKYCQYCGGETKAASVAPAAPVNSQPVYSQSAPAAPVTPSYAGSTPAKTAPRENVILGTVGALIGAALGGLSIVLLMQADIIASISGLLIAFCTLKGYELLGKKLGTTGIVICVILMLVVPICGYLLGQVVSCIQDFKDLKVDLSFSEAFDLVIQVIKNEPGDYVKDILILYLFVALGGYGTIANTIKSKKK